MGNQAPTVVENSPTLGREDQDSKGNASHLEKKIFPAATTTKVGPKPQEVVTKKKKNTSPHSRKRSQKRHKEFLERKRDPG